MIAGASARCVAASPVPKFLRARPPQDDGEDRKIRRLAGARHAPVGAENLCHQAIFVDDATCAVMPPDPEMVQVGYAVGQRAQWRGLLEGSVGPVLVVATRGRTW
jgi:hypothetical protein